MKHKILIVDDEANILKALKRLFIDTDYKIYTAISGAKGLELCLKEEIALIISDYRMPEMNGVQFLAKVKELHPETIRIVLSGFADVSAIVEAINDGQIYKFLSKPWDDQDLLTTIRRSLEHYDLQRENASLIDSLRVANTELQKITDGLEVQVEERTRDLAVKNIALQTTQRLLNLLPVGIIGVDNQGTLVYQNQALQRHIDTSLLMLGEPVGHTLDSVPLRPLKTALEENRMVFTLNEGKEGLRIICAPLPDQTGVVGLFSFEDLSRYTRKVVDETMKDEVPNV